MTTLPTREEIVTWANNTEFENKALTATGTRIAISGRVEGAMYVIELIKKMNTDTQQKLPL